MIFRPDSTVPRARAAAASAPVSFTRRLARVFLVGLGCALLGSAASAAAAGQKTLIKLGTLVPTGTSYHKSLLAMREKWRAASGGAVDLNIFPDGKLGGEADMVNLMNVGSLQAALVSSVGIAELDKSVAGLQIIPMGYRTLAEFDYVVERMRPKLEQRLADKGFVTLFWTDSGWIRFFSKNPILMPADLKREKFFTWSGSTETVALYKAAGFNPVALETADIMPGLLSGLITALPSPPFFALAGQIDTRAPHMLEINWVPLLGALVVKKATWDKIPPAVRPELLKVATETGREIKARGRAESDEAVAAMQKRKLTVTKLTPEAEAEWRKAAEAAYPEIRAKLVPAEVFDEVMRHLKEFRAKAGSP
jgi:TRAP-type C4-dicarboxylate transport system substrate-binding protein